MGLIRDISFILICFLLLKQSQRGLSIVCHCGELQNGLSIISSECPNNPTCTAVFGCFIQVFIINGIHTTRIGCISDTLTNDRLREDFCSNDDDRIEVFFCCNTDFCNNENLAPTLTPETTTVTTNASIPISTPIATTEAVSKHRSVYLGLTIGIPIVSILIIVSLLISIPLTVFCLRRRKKRLEITRQRRDYVDDKDMSPVPYSLDTLDIDGLADNTCTSGSGSGLPLLTQRTVARSITVGEAIGSGRFGQVFVGDYQGDKVAVKKFASRDEKSWFRETEIYNTVLLRHDNVLGFFASDMTSNNGVTELWLITQFHRHGSLYDYLNREDIEVSSRLMLRMATTICVGLAHLHTELFGTQGNNKPAIAHRDIKSKNILVKNNLECCIADFGLAVMKDPSKGVNFPTNPKQGTKRYMAPEILSETINMNHFESFKQADVYSLGLVLWEIFRSHSQKNDPALAYELPFQGLVPPDPSFEDMRRIIVVEKRQPAIPNKWHSDDLMRELTKVLRECWYFTSSARPTAVYLKKKLNQLSREDKLDYEEHE